MSSHIARWALLATTIASPGCSTSVASYSIPLSNVEAFKTLPGGKVGVATFTGVDLGHGRGLACGAGSIKMPANEPYEAYVRAALVDELKVAGLYSADAPAQIKGHLSHVAFTSSRSPRWELALIVTIGHGPSFRLERTYAIDVQPSIGQPVIGSIAGDCARTARAFLPAVQDLMSALAREPRFAKALASSTPTSDATPPK